MKRSYWISVSLMVVLALWLGSGQLPGSHANQMPEKEAPAAEVDAERALSVEVVLSESQPVVREISLQGQAMAMRTAQLAAETEGQIASLEVEKGQRVARGDLLARIAMDDRKAQLAQAKATVAQRKADAEAVRKLFGQGLQAETVLREREALFAGAVAALERVKLDIARTEIRAPFAGVVDDRLVEVGERIGIGEPMFTLVDDSGLKITAQLPQRDAQSISTGMPASARLITGVELEGEVSFVAAAADAQTRSYGIEVSVANPERLRVAGMSAELNIPVETLSGHFLSPGMLALDRAGSIGVKSVDEAGQVIFHPISIISTTASGAWVSGLPESLQVITLGQGFVEAGDRVETVQRLDASAS